MNYILSRLREPSTWAGLAVVAMQLPAAIAHRDPAAIGTAIAGAMAVLFPEAVKAVKAAKP